MGASGENVVYLKSVQVMVRLHVFPIFSYLAKTSAERWQHFCQKWKCRKNMQADNNLNRLYLKYLFTYLDNSGSIICFLLISNFWNNDILFQRRLNLRGYFKKMNKISALELFCLHNYKLVDNKIVHFYQDLLKILIENTYWKYLLKIISEI